MKKLIVALSLLALIAAPLFGAKILTKAIIGSNCAGLTSFNPVWSFSPNPAATDGNFDLKWGDNGAVPGSTGVWPFADVLIVMDLASHTTPQSTYFTCPFYWDNVYNYPTFALTYVNSNGNLKIPLNGPAIIANTYGQLAFQVFAIYSSDGGITYSVFGSELCTIYDLNNPSAYYYP